MLADAGLDFSFSGLKTAVAVALEAHGEPPHPRALAADVAASFQAAMLDVLASKTARALDAIQARALTLGGGVACNRALRSRLQAECDARAIPLRVPSPRLCADNAAMVALIGAWRLARGAASEPEMDAVASLAAMGVPA
jgi:N6-L-threonylcarbamoyladenine synthase